MTEVEQLYQSIVEGDAAGALAATKQALSHNVPAVDLIANFMIPAMDEVGRRFQAEEYIKDAVEAVALARTLIGAN